MTSNTRFERARRRTYEREEKRIASTRGGMSPKLVAALLTVGIVLLAGGGVFAATRPTWHPVKTGTASPRSTPAPHGAAGAARATPRSLDTAVTHRITPAHPVASTVAGTPAADVGPSTSRSGVSRSGARAPASDASPAISYTVRRGDTLSGIAEWFKLRGYANLFAENRAVIGSDPNVIFAGERITIRAGVMSVSRAGGTVRSGA